MNIYLAGPMRGCPGYNFPAFAAAAAKLRVENHRVFSPAEYFLTMQEGDLENEAVVREGFHANCSWICLYADAVALLPRWEYSRGAKAEKALAEAIGLKIIYLESVG